MANEFSITDRHFYINNCLGSFFRGVLDWFGDTFYPRIEYKVIGTYEKSVEYFNKVRQEGREINQNILPSLTLDPSLDFRPAEMGGRFLWQNDSLAPGLGSKLFNEIPGLEDQNVSLVPVFSRYEGEFQLMFWLQSIYEYFDIRLFLFQWSSGYQRRLRPAFFESFIVLPESINDFRYDDPTRGVIPLDWSNTDRVITKVNNIGQCAYTYPVKLTPQFWFTNISDGSTKFGGDTVAEYKLTVDCSFEIDLPTYLVITPYSGDFTVTLDVSVDHTYSRYNLLPFFDGQEYVKNGPTPGGYILSTKNTETPINLLDFTARSYYVFTEEDVTNWSTGDSYIIANPHNVPGVDYNQYKLISYVGLIPYGAEENGWIFSDDTKDFFQLNVEPKAGEMIEIFFYDHPAE